MGMDRIHSVDSSRQSRLEHGMKKFTDHLGVTALFILLWVFIFAVLMGAVILIGVLVSSPANATPDQDAAFDEIMYEKGGIELYPIAHAQAYWVCSQVQAGIHPQYVASQVAAANPSWYYETAELFVGSAILIYCPPDTRSEQS